MQIKPSASIRQNYNQIADLCRSTGEPVYLTKNGEGDLVVMDINTFVRREKMLKLREELLAVEEDRLAGRAGATPDELDSYLESIINKCFRPCPSDAGGPRSVFGAQQPFRCPQIEK